MDTTVVLAVLAGMIGIILFLLKGNGPSSDVEETKKKGKIMTKDTSGPKGAKKKKSRIAEAMRKEQEADFAAAQMDKDSEDEGEVDSEEEARQQEKIEREKELGIFKKKGAKHAAKLEAKEEKRAQNEAMKKERAEAKEKQEEEWAEQDRLKAEEAEQERREEEERAAVLEEKRKAEQEAYDAMKEDFEIEEEGEVNTDEQLDKEADLLSKFVEHIKVKKIVYLEELASNFSLKTQDCIDRIKQLLEDEILSGVIDDRGKFIYVTRVGFRCDQIYAHKLIGFFLNTGTMCDGSYKTLMTYFMYFDMFLGMF